MFKFHRNKKKKKWSVNLRPLTASSYRAVLWGYNMEEVAKTLGVPVRSLYRIKDKLKIFTLYLEDVLALKKHIDSGTTQHDIVNSAKNPVLALILLHFKYESLRFSEFSLKASRVLQDGRIFKLSIDQKTCHLRLVSGPKMKSLKIKEVCPSDFNILFSLIPQLEESLLQRWKDLAAPEL